ncbi:MAG: DUF4238 domain-containing protein [Candidatus Kapaibacterium sp.]
MEPRKHHLTPEYYLKGFTTEEDPKVLWRYQRDAIYNPGKHKKFNPALLAPKAVGWEWDFFATENFDGVRNYSLIERGVLMQIEQAAEEGIKFIRNAKLPPHTLRMLVAQYIVYLYRRVKAQRENLAKLWPESIRKTVNQSVELARKAINDPMVKLPWKESAEEALAKLAQYEREKYEKPIPGVLNLNLQHPLEQVEAALFEMRWIIIVNKTKFPFITSDNPVYFFRQAGLKNSDLTVPFSKTVALCATWRSRSDTVMRATENMVRKINRRTVSEASEYAYAPICERWILNMLQKSPYPFERLH